MSLKWWHDIVDIWRGTPDMFRAMHLLRQARRLRHRGDILKAFRSTVQAFGILRAPHYREHPAAHALLATDTFLLDELARELGHPGAARDDLAVALKICEDVAETSPRLQAQMKQYIDWYRHRLAEVNDAGVVH